MKLTPPISHSSADAELPPKSYTAATRILIGRGYTTDGNGDWRLPHALYSPTKFELELIKFQHEGMMNRGFCPEAKAELARQRDKPWFCKIGWHAYGGYVQEYGPQSAIQMNIRAGVTVAIYSGMWKTCFICGHQKMRGGIPKD